MMKPVTTNMNIMLLIIGLAVVTILATSFVLALTPSQSPTPIRGGDDKLAEWRIEKWHAWTNQQRQRQGQFTQHLHGEQREKASSLLYRDEGERHSHRRRHLELEQEDTHDHDHDHDVHHDVDMHHQVEPIMQQSQSTQYQYRRIKNELEHQSAVYATIQRSLREKYHIQWQLDQLKSQPIQWQQERQKEARLFPLSSRYETATTDAEQYPIPTLQSLFGHDAQNEPKAHDELIEHNPISNNNNNNNNHNRRKLEDALQNAYNTGRPGSTYGAQMFCGSSWAEASTSCNQRQNCPSGQSSECIMPGQECWAFTECDANDGDGAQFSELHGVTGAENLQASGIGAEASGGFVDLSKPSPDKKDHYFCGRGYDDAISKCASHCPSGSLMDCPTGEICFFNTPCDARMMTRAPAAPSPTTRPTTPAPVGYSSKLNKYFCGYDWDDAQERCEVWCPSGDDTHCPDDQLCFAFSKCHAVEMNAMTLEQMEKQKNQYQQQQQINNQNIGNTNDQWWEPGSGGSGGGGNTNNNVNSGGGGGFGGFVGGGGSPGFARTLPPTDIDEVRGYYSVKLGGSTRPTRQPTRRPTNKPSMSAEQAMHRFSFCGAFWTDARDNCETKQHCEDDRDCPEFEYCWTQTPCDHYATETPTTAPPTYLPTEIPTTPGPTGKPTDSPVGVTPTKTPTPEPTWEPTISPTYLPTFTPTISPKPTDKPTFDPDDPSLTFFCGVSWAQADETCGMRCPSGSTDDCPGDFQCWAFTSCEEERGIQTYEPTITPTSKPIVLYVPGYGGALVPVFGGADYSQFEPTKSPAPTASAVPTGQPTLPPGVVAKELLATYYCGIDWNDVEKNCHQACPTGHNLECTDPEHSCWAFVHACKAKTPKPTNAPITGKPTRTPITDAPTRGLGAPTTPNPTDPPTDLYGLLAGQKDRFYCSRIWNGIVCGESTPCPSGDDNDCPTGESCFSSTIDCDKQQQQPLPSPSNPPPTKRPTNRPTNRPTKRPTKKPNKRPSPDIDNKGEDWGSDEGEDINNEGEDWGDDEAEDVIDNEGEDWAQQTSDNEGEDWESSKDINNEGEDWDVNNEGEDWSSQLTNNEINDEDVNNDGEDWDRNPTLQPTTNMPTYEPTPQEPTPYPTDDPTIDLREHLENLKNSYFCSEIWDNIDCEVAQPCPSGDSKDCPRKQQCFSGTPCKSKEEEPEQEEPSPGGKQPGGRPTNPDSSPTPTIWTPLMGDKEGGTVNSDSSSGEIDAEDEEEEEEEVDEVTSKFFCGLSWSDLVAKCENAKPCPSGTNAECEGGQSCFANTPCADSTKEDDKEDVLETVGVFNFRGMVGNIPDFCNEKKKGEETMSRNVGYWQSWSIYRNETCNSFTASSIDASSYTHIVFSFASISATGTLEPWDFEEDIKGGQYQQFLDVKQKYSGTKAMVAVGGWTHNEPDNERLYRFSQSAATRKSRMKFAQSSVAFMRKYGFDGLDIDWEYPGDETRGGNATLDKDNLVLLCDELRKYFDDAPEKFELSLAVPASPTRFEIGFDLHNLAKSVHFFNVMAYDLHGVWDDPPVVGAHSDIGVISEAMGYMMNSTTGGVPPAQIIMGLPAYGRSYTMANDTCLSLGCPFEEDSNVTATGGCLNTNGFVPFVEIYDWTESGPGKGYDSIELDLDTYSAIMVKDGNQLISYDNAETFKAKVDYATSNCLGGTMVWAIDMLPLKTQSAGGKGGGKGGSGSSKGEEGNAGETQSILDEEQAILAFCGTTWDDAVSTCSRPCPSGLSEDCEQGETCFAGTPCGEGGVIAVGDTCRICPDTTSQGIRGWVEVEVDVESLADATADDSETGDDNDPAADASVVSTTKTTCGDLDYGFLLSVSKDSETCDSIKLDLGSKCCYTYPEDQCTLCRRGFEYYQVRSKLNVTMPDGTEATCGLVNQMLAPEENGGEKCVTAQDALFEECCYKQCRLCEGQGLKWWVEFEDEVAESRRRSAAKAGDGRRAQEGENSPSPSISTPLTDAKEENQGNEEIDNEGEDFKLEESKTNDKEELEEEDEEKEVEEEEVEEEEEEIMTCSSIDASLYSAFVEADTEECLEIKGLHSEECCYTFPTNPCGLCNQPQQGEDTSTSLTLLWANEVTHEGKDVSCGVIDNILNTEEESSPACSTAKQTHFDDCCFDKCKLCDSGQQLAWDYVIDFNNSSSTTCGDIEAIFSAEEVKANSDDCTSAKDDYMDVCCFTPPVSPCELCPEFVRWDTEVEFDGEESTCKEAVALLKREESDGDVCLTSKEDMTEACCYELCNICSSESLELTLDWDAVVEYASERLACGDFKPIFGRAEIEEGTEECSGIKEEYQDYCCYVPPAEPCNLCQTDTDFMDAYSDVEVNFWGSAMNCSDVYDYLIRRIESDSETCSSAKESIIDDCCYKKCAVCELGQMQEFEQTIELKDEIISCQQLHTVRMTDIAVNSSQCTSMQSKFADTCCYDAPETPCMLCTEGAVRKELEVDFNGGTETCEHVANFLASRENNGTEECTASKVEYQDFCCFDKCSLCKESEQIDWDSYVEFDGKEGVSCGSFDWYFTDNSIEEGTGQCTDLQVAHGDTCCYEAIDYSVPACFMCKRGDAWYDVNPDVEVYFEGSNRTCAEVSNSLFRKFEDESGFCNAAKAEYFEPCCFTKCDLCQGAQLDANVEVAYNDTATSCLELGLNFVTDIVIEGSAECDTAREILFEPCCYTTPTDPCRLCSHSLNALTGAGVSQGDVRDRVSVNFYGSTTTCFDLNSFLVSREEQGEFMCQAAKAELQETCCFQECDMCSGSEGGNLYWDNPTTFNNITFACGELTWVLSGSSIEEGSDECNGMQSTYYDDCCSGPSALIPDAGNKCLICPDGKDWYAQVVHDGKPMTCLELDSVLLQKGVFDVSPECAWAKADYSSQCCYTPPTNPCNLCQAGKKSYSVLDQTVAYNGAETNCYGIYNYLWTRMETEDDACLVTQNDLFDDCCYAKCSICGDYQLDQEAIVMHDGTSMACSEIENHYVGLNQITQGSEQCGRIQQEHWNNCCYDIPCELCTVEDTEYELLVDEPALYMGMDRPCGDWAVLAEGGLSQEDLCTTTKMDLFDRCCFKQCNLCEDPDTSIDWNRPLTYEGLASTCLAVYMNLRSEKVQDGHDRCQSVQYTVSNECCRKMPTNQCSLCQTNDGSFLNTNWNSEVIYGGETVTCGDVNAMLSSEELDNILCLSARDDFWYQCCTPPREGGGNIGLGGILPTLEPGVSDSDESVQSGWTPTTTDESPGDDGGFSSTAFFRRNGARGSQTSHTLIMVPFISFVLSLFLSS